jgi:iron complex outermembrane receptor protein
MTQTHDCGPRGRVVTAFLNMKPLFGVWGGLTWCAFTPFVAQAQTPGSVPDAADAAAVKFLDAVSVTATREKTPLQETPASVGVVDERAIRFSGLTHPQQILGQIPGVAVGVTNGEGHNMAIRQPFSTSPLYLYLEDGIPTRATGFFNHNALYEVNLPQAGGIEVVRGPGSALYGSDAVAGTVNVLTRAPARQDGVETAFEVGSLGWARALIDATVGTNPDGGLRISLHRSHSNGWRQQTGYDRTSLSLRWDQAIHEQLFAKTILGFTAIDQQTGANSPLIRADYENNPTRNNFAPAYRRVQALRASSEISYESGANLITVTPYVRSNQMDLNGSYNFSSDPRIEKTDVTSLGVWSKWRRNLGGPLQLRWITGVDLEQSPGTRTEDALSLTKTGSGAATTYTGYSVGARIYDYAVKFQSQSVYGHLQFSPTSSDVVTLGLRQDHLTFDLDNHLSGNVQVGTKFYGQSPDTSVSYNRLSPKLGYTHRLSAQASLYASHNHGFRVPSESQLFRGGSDSTDAGASAKALLALSLKPIRVRQTELGVRGSMQSLDYDVVAYRLEKYDDLLNQRDLATNVSTTVNAGKTLHQGIEAALGLALDKHWRIDSAISLAQHKYMDWMVSGSTNANYSGNAIESAPKTMANTRLTWQPNAQQTAQLEWVYLGSYWLEASNSPTYGKYEGHQLFHLRYSHALSASVELTARINNLTDKRYADSASVSSLTPVFAPALPRSVYAGVKVRW